MDILVRLDLEAHHILRAFAKQSVHLRLGECQRIAHLHTGGGIILKIRNLFTLGLQLLRGVKGDICLARIEEHLHIFLINIPTFGLAIRTIVSSEANAFVEMYAQPLERLQDIFLRPGHKTVAVRVLDAEHQVAPMLACKEIIIQRSTHTTDVQGTRRTGRKTYSDPSFCHIYRFLFLSLTYLDGKITPFFPYY